MSAENRNFACKYTGRLSTFFVFQQKFRGTVKMEEGNLQRIAHVHAAIVWILSC